ncbi:Sec-independent protein translocase protein TatB [Thermodesulfobacteriota bacterium]
MFGLGFPEVVLIFVVALIVFGPKRLPELAKSLGNFVGNFKHAANNIKNDIEFHANLDDEKRSIDDKYRQLEEESKTAGNENEDID